MSTNNTTISNEVEAEVAAVPAEEVDDEEDKKSEVFEKDDANKSLTDADMPDDAEDPEEEKPIIGSLDKPIEILTGKRDRKSRDFLVIVPEDKKPAEAEPDYTQGKGTEIGKIPYAKYQINQEPDEDLLVLYRLMYRGQPKWINWARGKILKFKGYPFGKESKYFNAHRLLCNRLTISGVRYINELLGLEHGKDRTHDEMIGDLFEFLQSPKDLGKEIPPPPPPKSKPKTKKPSRSLPKGYAFVRVNLSESEDDEVVESSEDEGDGRRKSRRSSVKIIASPKKKAPAAKKTQAKKTPAKKSRRTPSVPKSAPPAKKSTPRSNKRAAAAAPSRSSSRGAGMKRGAYEEVESDEEEEEEEVPEEDSDDEVLVKAKPARGRKSPAKKKKETPKKPPSNAELKRAIRDLLKDADLSSITMKKILNQIYDKYSDHNLSAQKEFLKRAVKECL